MNTAVMPSVRTLLEHIVDYAGLFPPAELDLATVVEHYARDLAGPEQWMLGRLIMPTGRLDEFEKHATGILPAEPDDEPWRLSALTVPAGDEQLAAQIERIKSFNQRHAEPEHGLVQIDVIELRGESAATIDAALDVIPDELFPFFELPVDQDPRGLIAALVGSDAGAKVRTGGVTADQYPATADLARFIAACAQAGVAFKATAGLHHPLRHRSEQVGTDEHGFLNVFVAAALAACEEVAATQLAEILEERNAEAFLFHEAGMSWAGHELGLEQIEDTRLVFAVSYGSCSFDEPIADLRALGLL